MQAQLLWLNIVASALNLESFSLKIQEATIELSPTSGKVDDISLQDFLGRRPGGASIT
jgi:hypothetical protein